MSYTNSNSFTFTNARYLASKVAADLKRIQRFYDRPSDSMINNYETEVSELLRNGYLEKVIYGFKRDECWVEPTLIYNAKDLIEISTTDDDPGKIQPGANLDGASFTSFLLYTNAWHNLSKEERNQFKNSLPFQRGFGKEPGVDGYIQKDNTYSSGGKSLNRSSVKTNR